MASRIEVRRIARTAGLAGAHTVISSAKGKTVLAELSKPGSFSVNLAMNDAVLSSLGDGDYIQFLVDGTKVFTGVYDRDKTVIRHPQNEAEQTATISGLGLISEWEAAVVRGPTPVGSDLEGDVRYFDWSSVELDDSGWDAATVLYNQNDPPGESKAGKPLGFPSGVTPWVWSDTHSGDYLYDPGTSPFRGSFTLADDTSVAIYMAADDGFVARLDGIDLGGNGKVNGWQDVWRVDVDLKAGDHVVAVLAENYDRLASTNTAGFICAVYSLDSSGRDDVLISATSGGTKTMHYPATLPGFTAGHVLRILLEEEQAAGGLTGWTLNCTDTLDADGIAWPVDQSFAFDVGRSLADVLEELASAHIDYTVSASTKTLNVYNLAGAGSPTTVGNLTPSLLELKGERRGQIKNALLVRDKNGYFEVTNAASVAAVGERWGYLALGNVEDREHSTSLAQAEVDRLSSARDQVQPVCDGRLLDAAGVDALVNWLPGDYITCPSRSLVATDYRTLSIGIEEDDDGLVTVAPTLNSRIDAEAERMQRAIERMERGSLQGRSLVSSPPQPADDVRVRKAEIETVTVSWPGAWSVAGAVNRYLNAKTSPIKINSPGRWVWAEYSWNTSPATDVILEYTQGGGSIATHTLPASTDPWNEYPTLLAERNKIEIEVTDDDLVAEGLTAKLHFLRFI